MSPRNARALSTAVVGGVGALVFFRFGLYFWVGLLAWAVAAEAGEDSTATKKTIGGAVFGALLAWAALVVSLLIPVPPDGWLWVPRLAAALALSLYLLEMGTAIDLFSKRLACLAGYASVLGAAAITATAEGSALVRYTSVRHANPLVSTVIALVGGVLLARVAKSMEKALA